MKKKYKKLKQFQIKHNDVLMMVIKIEVKK